jgi:NADPH2:quinone reductase
VFRLFEKSIKVSGFVLNTVMAVPDAMRRGIEESLRLIAEKTVKIVVGKSFPLAQAVEAHRFMESRQSTGKLVLIP